MGLSGGALGMGFVAGVLSTLSPCVVPLIPLVVGGALTVHRLGLLALTVGMVISYVAIGIFVASIGFSIGLDDDLFRTIAAVMLILFGIVLLSSRLQARFAMATAAVGNSGHGLMARVAPRGLAGQMLLGLLLGAVWSPCVGPTLGAAVIMASQGRNLAEVSLVMIAFGIGTAVPLLALGVVSREVMMRWRGKMMQAGKAGKCALGAVAIAIGLSVATGVDHTIETVLVDASPDWLTDLTTKY